MTDIVRRVFLDAAILRQRPDDPDERAFSAAYRMVARTVDRAVRSRMRDAGLSREGHQPRRRLHSARGAPCLGLPTGNGRDTSRRADGPGWLEDHRGVSSGIATLAG